LNTSVERYHIFATAQAILAAMVVFGLGLLYKLRPDLTRNSSAAFAALMLAVLIVGYYLSFHQLLKRKLVLVSTIIVSVLAAAEIWLVISQTGGLDSPYLAIWLIFIAALGILGAIWPIVAASATVAIYATTALVGHTHGSTLTTRLIQLAFTIVAMAAGEFIAVRGAPGQPKKGGASSPLSSEQLETQVLMASMGEGVIVVNALRQIQLFNHAAQMLTGWDAASAQNLDYRTVLKLKTARDQVVDDTSDPFMQAWTRKATIVSSDFVITTQAGRRFIVTMTTSPIYTHDGQIAGGITLFRDISAEKAMGRQRDEFISTASHEMRTPIAAIEGYLSLAMNPATATVDDRAKSYLEKAHDSIGHLGELFKNLLMITKLEDKSLADKVAPVNVSQIVEKAVEDMQTLAAKKGLTLQLTSGNQLVAEANPVMPLYQVRGNLERLREVVMNLIENAIKYTPAGRVTVNITGDTDTVTVGVSDSGMGIAAEDLPHLFQKFYRVDNTATRTIGGTGLGLYICRTVVELYGGRIWAESRPGSGSTFAFRLPRLRNEVVAAEAVDTLATPDPSVAPLAPVAVPDPAAVATPAPVIDTTASPTPPAAPTAEPVPVATAALSPLPETPAPIAASTTPAQPVATQPVDAPIAQPEDNLVSLGSKP